jgi:hypothetical protein
MKNRLLTDIFSALLVLLFIYTAVNKLFGIQQFHRAVGKMQFLQFVAWPVAIAVPVGELFISVLLLVPKYRRAGLLFSAILLSLFTVYLIFMVALAPKLPCSCGGVLQSLSWKQHILFNIFFVVISMVAYKQSKESISFSTLST